MDRTPLPAAITNSIYYQRWLWHWQDRVLPGGGTPDYWRERALETIRQTKSPSILAPDVVVPGNAWVPIGPAPILSGANATSGRIGDIAVNPANPNHWLVGAAQGGIWETVNAGTTWKAKTDDQPSLAFGAIAFAPGNTNIIYAGTGEEVFSGDAKSGAGMLKSTNGGATWQVIASATFNRSSFTEIKVHPTNPDIVIVSTASGIYKSSNGGANWSNKLGGTGTDLEVDPTSFTNLFCALGNTGGSSANGLYHSTDAGETWQRVDGPWTNTASRVGRIQLAIAPSARGTLYVSIQDTGSGGGTSGVSLGIWRTDTAWDAAPVWTQLPAIATSTQLWYDHEIIVDPANPNIIYFGETNLRRYNGTAWSTITGSTHVDFHSFAWAGNRLIVGSDGGVWSTTNGGSSFNNHNATLQITQFYHGFANPAAPNFALGASQDNGTERWDGTNGWRSVRGGDGADCAIATSNPSNYWATSYQNLAIQRTRNGGVSYDDATAGLDLANAPFIGAFEKAWNNDDIFITGTTVLFKTTNFFSGSSVSWFTNSPDVGSGLRAFAFAKSDPANNTYAFGASSGALRLTANGGANWVNIAAGNQVPNRSISDLAFNPTNANILYASVSGFSGGALANFYRTTNALAASPSWVNLSYPVDVGANTIAIDESDPNVIYVGTDIGVWKSANGGTNWTHMGPEAGMPNVEVDELSLQNGPGRLIAFTHGRGAFLLVQANSANLALSQTVNNDPASVGCDLTFTLTAAIAVWPMRPACP